MNPLLRTSLLATSALASIDAQAKPLERCILSLEARPTNDEAREAIASPRHALHV